jgi:predicted aconitase
VAIRVQADTRHWTVADYGALGYHAGKLAGNRIPYFTGIRPEPDGLKALGAAMAATGAVALYHVEGVTPDAKKYRYDPAGLETMTVEGPEVRQLFREVPVDAVALGCPHCSPGELGTLARLLAGRRTKKPLYIFASQGVIDANRGVVDAIEKSGAKVYADTCMVVSPVMERYRGIMVNSGKALAYVPDMCGAVARIGTTEECVKVATE